MSRATTSLWHYTPLIVVSGSLIFGKITLGSDQAKFR
jgi:hypothetical protein